ncbi:MAG: hypothetical protein WCB64_03045, partial [Desulfobaccales bacterium]
MLRKRAFIALVVTAISITSCIMACSQPINKQTVGNGKTGKLSQQKTSKQENPPPQYVTHQQMVDAIIRAIDASNEKSNTYQPPSPPNKFSGLFQLLLTIFTGGLVIVGGIECYIIFNTLKETQIVAKAAIDSAEVAKMALQVAERAYLKIDKFEFFNFEVNKFPRVTYEIHNVGHTPA